MRVLVTGFAGFIGSNLVRRLLEYSDTQIIGLDAYTYAARPQWVFDYLNEKKIPDYRFQAVKGDLADKAALERFIETASFDHVIHLAAESHVCRSIEGPDKFIQANVLGTFHLLEACRKKWKDNLSLHRFHHVSTDEVFGSLSLTEPPFDEDSLIQPTSPYAASKASSDHLALAYHHTYGMNVTVTNCSNNFGPNQHEEKLIPRAILRMLRNEPMTIYGDGKQVRDWIWVDEHVEGIFTVMDRGRPGERYLLGGEKELSNIAVIEHVRKAMSEELNRNIDLTLEFTDSRPTDDRRYAISNQKMTQLGWAPKPHVFEERLRETIRWYAGRLGL